jgi:hypothetical protein
MTLLCRHLTTLRGFPAVITFKRNNGVAWGVISCEALKLDEQTIEHGDDDIYDWPDEDAIDMLEMEAHRLLGGA